LRGGFERGPKPGWSRRRHFEPGPKRLTRLKVAIVLGAACISALRGQVGEYQVKAFFLYNFARYVEWPSQSFKAPNDPIVICILGQNPFGSALDQAIAGKMVAGRPFAVRQLSNFPPGGNCHVLFVNSSEGKRFRGMAERLKGGGVLSVGESQGFTADGGVINFKLEDGKVRFEIDVDAAGREHLRISSKLLSLAQIARKPEDGK
jgi:hypothetical protein